MEVANLPTFIQFRNAENHRCCLAKREHPPQIRHWNSKHCIKWA